MTVTINVAPADLSPEQREAVAGFILNFPAKSCTGAGACHSAAPAAAPVPAFLHKDTADKHLVELGKLQHDHDSTMPGVAFGDPLALSAPLSAAAAFGAPPPPVSIAPTLPTRGDAFSGGAVDLDAKGLPWDGRIHSSGKTKVKDGTWRVKGGVPPERITAVEAELRGLMLAPGADPLAPSPAPTAPTPPPAPVAPAIVSLPTASASPPVAAPLPPAAPQAPVACDARAEFVALIGRASAAIQRGTVTTADVNQCCIEAGVPALPLLGSRLDLVATVAASIDALIASRA